MPLLFVYRDLTEFYVGATIGRPRAGNARPYIVLREIYFISLQTSSV